MMNIILAVDNSWAIGRDNDMVYRIKKDLAHFKDLTFGNPVIMGRKTFDSIGKALVGRENIVLTRNRDFKADGVLVFHKPEDILSYLKDCPKEIFVIGGQEIVEVFLSYCQRAYITKIDSTRKADTYLHNFDEDDDFFLLSQSQPMFEDGLMFRYCIYERKYK